MRTEVTMFPWLVAPALAIAPVPDRELVEWPYALAAGDLDGDGHDDLLSLDGSSDLQIYGGNALGITAVTRVVRSPYAIALPGALAVLDADGDGYDDVVVVDTRNGYDWEPRLHRGGPQGLQSAVTATLGAFQGFAPPALATGDTDGDGYEDLVGCEQQDPYGLRCTVAFGDAAASMGATVDRPLPANQTRVGVALTDFDGDGRDEVVTADPARGVLGVVAGAPRGAPPSTGVVGAPAGARFGTSLAGGVDLDGDTFEDLAVATSDGFATVLGSPAGPRAAVPVRRVPASAGAASLAASEDVDGDGSGEVLAAWPSLEPGGLAAAGAVGLYLGGRTAPAVPGPYAHRGDAGQNLGTFLATGDFDADGVADRAFGTVDGWVGVVYGP